LVRVTSELSSRLVWRLLLPGNCIFTTCGACSMVLAVTCPLWHYALRDLRRGHQLVCLADTCLAQAGCRSSGVEHSLGKGEVESSNLSGSTSQQSEAQGSGL
jgi:hypothetical protein